MSFLKYIKRNTWLLMLLVSFVMYEALWSLIEFQLGELYFDTKDILCDFAQCVLFTSAVFFVNYGFRKYRGGRYAESTAEIICIFIVGTVVKRLKLYNRLIVNVIENSYLCVGKKNTSNRPGKAEFGGIAKINLHGKGTKFLRNITGSSVHRV